MKTKGRLLTLFTILAFMIFNAFICSKSSGNDRENDPLPDKRPDRLSISLGLSGGMLYYSEDLYISSDSCYYFVNDGGAISKFYFKISSDDFDKLYKVFTDNRFDEIKTHEEMIYDRGGEFLRLSWGKGKYCEISNSGMSVIKDSWQKEWSACVNAVNEVVKTETEKQKKNYEIRIDKAFMGMSIYLYVNNQPVVPQNKPLGVSGDYLSKIVPLTPGKHRVTFNWEQKHFTSFIVNADSSSGVLLEMKNDSLKTTFFN